MQGESDRGGDGSKAAAYQANLTDLITDVRATYGADIPFVIGQLSDGQARTDGLPDYLMIVQDAQAAVAAASPLNFLVETNCFSLYDQDPSHFDADGQFALGQAFASKLQVTAVPEPSSGFVVLAATAAFCFRRRRAGLISRQAGNG